MISRTTDMLYEHNRMLLPVEGYQNLRLMSLNEAIEPLIPFFPEDYLLAKVWIVKERCKEPADGLSQDEAASIMLYTVDGPSPEESFYFKLNETLRTEEREKLKPWFPYLRLFIQALLQLPAINDTIYRGVKRDIGDTYQPNTMSVWWGFSSCTGNIQTLESAVFCGNTGSRTIFHIKCLAGRNIKKHSYYHSEDEVLLMPGRYLQVRGCYRSADGLCIVQLDEIEPPHQLLKLPDGSPWRRIAPGSSLLGTCTNSVCHAYRREVIIPIDFQRLDVVSNSSSLATCPVCTGYVEVLKLGFNKCQWRIHGIRQAGRSQAPARFEKDWCRAPRNSLFEYNLEQEGVIWRQLIIETRPENYN